MGFLLDCIAVYACYEYVWAAVENYLKRLLMAWLINGNYQFLESIRTTAVLKLNDSSVYMPKCCNS